MKIVIFEPHPDDLLMGPGHYMFQWIEEGHDIHVVTVTDGRNCYIDQEKELRDIPKKEVANTRINEAKKAIEFLGLPPQNLHLLLFRDAYGPKYVEEGIEKVKNIVMDAERLVLPSKNNRHVDHQATHDICMGAAMNLNLTNVEYWVYFIPSYGQWNKDSEKNKLVFEMNEEIKEKLLDWLQIYQSQKKIKKDWKMYSRYLKYTRTRQFRIFKKLEDYGKYYNF